MNNDTEQIKTALGATVEMVAFATKEFERKGFGRVEAITAALEVVAMLFKQGGEVNGRKERNQ